MKLTNKSLKLAGMMALSLIGASPLAMSSAADAAPMKPIAIAYHGGATGGVTGGFIKVANNNVTFRFGYDEHRYGDRFHKPPPKFERIARPHFARHFHQGHWEFRYGHWVWVKGFWTR